MNLNSCPNNHIEFEGKNYLYFGGTAYLGLPNHVGFQEIIIENIRKWGTSYGSSRMANINLNCFDHAENYLAEHIGARAAITLSSGMLCGKIVVNVLKKIGTTFYHFDGNHEAISIDGSLPFYVNQKINPKLIDGNNDSVTLLTDGVLSGQVVGFNQNVLSEISPTKNVTLVIDESHSLGIMGDNGAGIFATIDNPIIKNKILVSSLGKAFGTTGGVIAADTDFIDQVKQNSIYGSSAGMNPGFAQSIPEAKSIYLEQLQKLKENLKYIDQHLKKSKSIIFKKDYPLIYPQIEGINNIFLDKNIVITHFKYPNSDQNLNRIVVTANHTCNDLDQMIGVLNQQ